MYISNDDHLGLPFHFHPLKNNPLFLTNAGNTHMNTPRLLNDQINHT